MCIRDRNKTYRGEFRSQLELRTNSEYVQWIGFLVETLITSVLVLFNQFSPVHFTFKAISQVVKEMLSLLAVMGAIQR